MNIFKAISKPLRAMLQLSAFCISLMLYRYFRTDNYTYFFLIWNLFLAWVPLGVAIYLQHRCYFHHRWQVIILFGVWLLFFPNAPYLITDLVHLNNKLNPAVWSDMIVLFSFAVHGLLLGLYSLLVIHKIIMNYVSNVTAWIIVIFSLVMSGYGIFLGRIQRWNSWDIIVQPRQLLIDAVYHLGNNSAIKMSLGFAALLFIAYLMLKSLTPYEQTQKQP